MPLAAPLPVILLTLAIASPLTACNPAPSSNNTPPPLLLAASSTTDAIDALLSDLLTEPLAVSHAGSNTLSTQVLAGVAAGRGGVLLIADPRWADVVADAGWAADRVALLANSLVLITPANPEAHGFQPWATPPTTSDPRPLALAGEAVPAGRYADQALQHPTQRSDPALTPLHNRRVIRGQHARSVLAYVASGEAAAGVVYATDARATDAVRIAHRFPPHTHDPITYTLVLLRPAPHQPPTPQSQQLFNTLQSPAALDRFTALGFRPLPQSEPAP
ncbi:MAG: molybdate ABC transporter substrate-binding protein [Planctomycetota bacterium]